MEYLSDVALLCIVLVNLAVILLTCILSTGTAKHLKKKNMIATIVLLLINLIFDAVCLVGFVRCGMEENGAIFVLFFPLTGWLLYEAVKEVRTTRR